jgi:hypothetical protein
VANNRLQFTGLAELRAALRNLPAELTVEASREVEGAANGAAADIKRAYPVRSGNLRDGLIVKESDRGRFHAGSVVVNTSRHSHLFEYGTQTRQNRIGANRGAMPPGNVFVPAVIRARRLMYDRLKALLERNGLVVSGDA